MGRQLIIRLIQTFLSLIGMSLLIFILVRASGDPVDLMRSSTTTDAEIAHLLQTRWIDPFAKGLVLPCTRGELPVTAGAPSVVHAKL